MVMVVAKAAPTLRVVSAGGDGLSDDTAALQAAIDAAAAGGTVSFPALNYKEAPFVYKTSSPIVVNKALTIDGAGSQINLVTDGVTALKVTASNVKIRGLHVVGPGSSAFRSGSVGIQIAGVFNAGLAPTYISDVKVDDCTIEQFNEYGLLASYVSRFSFERNTVRNVVYGGIVGLSVSNGVIEGNVVDTVNGNSSPNGLAYGIGLSRLTTDAGELTSQPRSENVVVNGNRVFGVTSWEGYDTHAGKNIVFAGNVGRNVKCGIAVGASKNSAGVDTYAPLNVTVSGNALDSGVTDGSALPGIVFQGIVGGEAATGSIGTNAITGFGDQSNAISGGYLVYATVGLSIAGGSLVNCAPNGINVYQHNVGFTVNGVAIVDSWSDTAAVGEAVGMRVNNDNTGVIGNCSFVSNGLSKTYLLATATGKAIRVESGSTQAINLGANYSAATLYVYDPGSLVTGK